RLSSAVAVVVSVWASLPAAAAVVVVDDADGGAPGTVPAACTFLAAIAATSTNSAVDGCAAGSSGEDTISFDAALADAVVVLTDTALNAAEALIIDGSGAAGLTLSLQNTSLSTSRSLTLRDLRFADSNTSGTLLTLNE